MTACQTPDDARRCGAAGPGPARRSVLRDLADPAATEALAGTLARLAAPGDVIALSGELGAGKTTFARAFVRARARHVGAAEVEEVPSPTFTLVQTYELAGGAVWHFDLYRLAGPEEVRELGFEEATIEGICLIEWPDRMGPLRPAERLDIRLRFGAGPGRRRARLIGRGGWARRLGELDPGG